MFLSLKNPGVFRNKEKIADVFAALGFAAEAREDYKFAAQEQDKASRFSVNEADRRRYAREAKNAADRYEKAIKRLRDGGFLYRRMPPIHASDSDFGAFVAEMET